LKSYKPLKTIFLCVSLLLFLLAERAQGADLGTPRLSDSIAEQDFFDPARFVTSGGLKYKAPQLFTLEPQVGVGYDRFKTDAGSGFAEISHKFHAEGGGRVDFSNLLYLSVAAKIPLYTYETTGDRPFGSVPLHDTTGNGSYDLLTLSPERLSWRGEAGIRLGGGAELNIFFDQTPLGTPLGGSLPERMEERFGTRFIFRFH
jgi:hypothetical protein